MPRGEAPDPDSAVWFPTSGQAEPVSLPLTVFPPSPDAEWRPLARELGIPDDVPWAEAKLPGEVYIRSLDGYMLRVFGVRHPPLPAPPGPFVYVEPPGGGPRSAFVIQAWQTWVMADGSPVVAEVRWHPERGVTASIRGLENTTAQRKVDRARRGLALLLGSGVLRGRRPGWRGGLSLDGQALIDWYRTASEYYANESRMPSLQDLAQHLRVKSHNTAQKRWGEVTGLPWPPPAELLEEDDDGVI